MNDRVKMIKGLEEALVVIGKHVKDRFIGNSIWALFEAIKLLKAQEPRVMTLEGIGDGDCYWLEADEEIVIRPVICIRKEDGAQKNYISFTWQFGTISLEAAEYGKRWRCWSARLARPTDEQREATPWD